MKKIFNKTIWFVALIVLLGTFSPAVMAKPSSTSYNYNVYGESVPVPLVYTVDRLVDGESIGVSPLKNPTDMVRVESGDLYVLDSGNNRILVLDKTLKVKKTINSFTDDTGKALEGFSLANARGIYVNRDQTIWLAMGADERVIQLDQSGKLLKQYGKPTGKTVPADMFFKPIKVVVGPDDTIYIVSEGVFQGIITLDKQGKFLGFFGSNRVDVTLSVITDVLWKNFYNLFSDTAAENMKNIVPIEYSSMDMDKKGFLYAVTATSTNSMLEIKKLDPKGNNIIRLKSGNDVSVGVKLNIGNYGDIETNYDKGVMIDTKFVDISVDANGFISALDQQRGRIFQYDSESNLIGIIGGYGQTRDTFVRPVAVESMGDTILVLDADTASITVFKPTAFGATVREATMQFNQGLYAQSEELWTQVLNQSANYDLAYNGLAKALFTRRDYVGAMKYAKLGYDKKTYDEAYTQLRKDLIRQNMLLIIGIAVLLVLLVTIGSKILKKRGKKLTVSKNTKYIPISKFLFHPFQAAEDIKIEGYGVPWHSIVVVAAVYLTRILSMGLTGFLFNNVRMELIDVGKEFVLIFGLYAIFIIANWSVSTLMEGEGKWKEITIVTGYSFIPMVFGNIVSIVLSNVLTMREGAILSLVSSLGLYWSVFLLFISIMTIHRYSVGKAIVSLLVTFVGMIFIVFLGVLIYSLTNQILTFGSNIFTEILFRI